MDEAVDPKARGAARPDRFGKERNATRSALSPDGTGSSRCGSAIRWDDELA